MTVDTVRDLTGQAVSHRIHETQVVQRERLWWVAPTRRPFFTRGLTVHDPLRGVDLIAGDDYCVIHLDDEWSTRTQQELGHFLVILDGKVGSILDLTYQTLGGGVLEDAPTIQELRDYITTSEGNPRWGEFIRREVVDPDIEAILELTKRVTFQHVVEETESIRTAILYGDAEHHQEMMTYAVDTRARYYNRILQLLQTARDAINAHAADKFGHSLTKDQVGLEHYPNYPVATRIVLEAGASSKHLLTPKGFSVMLARFADGPLQEHYLEEPAHNLTPAQIGLSNIHNYPLANPTEAQLGTRKDRYMTPGVTLDAMHYQFSSKLYAHQVDDDAHEVTPFQVGLGNYANYSLYDPQDFDAAPTIDNQYMTPKGVYDLIRHHYWDDQLSHVYDKNNPHQLTAAQIGLGNVTNLSRDAYDALYSSKGHHHTARTLPFTDGELKDWNDTAKWVLDSRVTNKVSGTIWSAVSGKAGKTIVDFPDTESTALYQRNTILRATNRQTGEVEEREGTVSLMVEQLESVAASGTETAVIPWKTVVLGDGAVADKVVPDLPGEATAFTAVVMTSTNSELSTLSREDVSSYVEVTDMGAAGHRVTVDEVALRGALLSDIDPAIPTPVTFFFEYDRPIGGVYRGRYEIDKELFWLESTRLFPELTYHKHEVVGDIFYLSELPERLKGPDGIFFRDSGHYPYLRSQATTKGDVGLSKVPDWDESDFDSRYAAANHTHSGMGWIGSYDMQQTYLSKNDGDLVNSIKARVFNYVVLTAIRNNALKQLSLSVYKRLPEFISPVPGALGNAQYRDTFWSVTNYTNGPSIVAGSWSTSRQGGHSYGIPCIRPNTGSWRVVATHNVWSRPNGEGGDYSQQAADLEFDTGDPLNPAEWVYDIYATMLARGGNPYGLEVGNNGVLTWLDPTGPSYWMNQSGLTTKKELQKSIAMTTIGASHAGGGPSAGSIFGTPQPYYNSVAFMNANYPGWNWSGWEDVKYGTPSSDIAALDIVINSFNVGNRDIPGQEEYRNARKVLHSVIEDPLRYQIHVEKRTSTYVLYS